MARRIYAYEVLVKIHNESHKSIANLSDTSIPMVKEWQEIYNPTETTYYRIVIHYSCLPSLFRSPAEDIRSYTRYTSISFSHELDSIFLKDRCANLYNNFFFNS